MRPSVHHLVVPGLAALALLPAMPGAHAQLNTAVTPYATNAMFQTGTTTAGAPATNVVNFEDTVFAPGFMGTDFIPTFTKLGFVTFNTNSNYRQEVIEGTNVGQAGNKVYFTLATNKALPLADVTFGAGVLSLGFDFKDGAGNGSAGALPQVFTFTLFSGSTSLGTVMSPTLPPGNTFSFVGFTSTMPITELVVSSQNLSPNQDLVLDNFAVSSPVPEPATVTVVLDAGLLGVALVRARRRSQRS